MTMMSSKMTKRKSTVIKREKITGNKFEDVFEMQKDMNEM